MLSASGLQNLNVMAALFGLANTSQAVQGIVSANGGLLMVLVIFKNQD
jgi:hypothetical protein